MISGGEGATGGLFSDDGDVLHVSPTKARKLQIRHLSPPITVRVWVSLELLDYSSPVVFRGEIQSSIFRAQLHFSRRILQLLINLSCQEFLRLPGSLTIFAVNCCLSSIYHPSPLRLLLTDLPEERSSQHIGHYELILPLQSNWLELLLGRKWWWVVCRILWFDMLLNYFNARTRILLYIQLFCLHWLLEPLYFFYLFVEFSVVFLQIYSFLGLLMVDPSTDKTGVVVG